MTEKSDDLIAALHERASGRLEHSVKIVVTDEGTLWVDGTGAHVMTDDSRGDPDVILTASSEVFRGLFDGSRNPTMAYMTGALRIDGSMTKALQVSAILTG